MKNYLIILLILISFSFAEIGYYRPLNAGFIIGRNIGGNNYSDTKILGVNGEYVLNQSIGLAMEYKTYKNTPSPEYSSLDEESVSLISVYMNRYKNFRMTENNGVNGLASVGAASMTINDIDKIYFILGIGLQVALADRINLELSLKDYMKEFSIPFTSFPEVHVAALGGGKHYINLNINLSLNLGDLKPTD